MTTSLTWRSLLTLTALLIAADFVTPPSALAQETDCGCDEAGETPDDDRVRKGFWIGFGLGGGYSSAGSVFGQRQRGGAAYVRLGGTVNDHVLFGGEALVWFREQEPGVDFERVNATATALIYPSTTEGLFFKGGFGVATVGSPHAGNERNGVGATLGMGYDFRLGRNFFVTPNLDFLVQFLDDSTPTSLLFTLGVVWH